PFSFLPKLCVHDAARNILRRPLPGAMTCRVFSLAWLPCLLMVAPVLAVAAPAGSAPELFGIRIEFLLFALVLLGIALFHRHTFNVALTGAIVIVLYKLIFTGFAA